MSIISQLSECVCLCQKLGHKYPMMQSRLSQGWWAAVPLTLQKISSCLICPKSIDKESSGRVGGGEGGEEMR